MATKNPWEQHNTIFAALILVVILVILGFAIYPVGEFGLGKAGEKQETKIIQNEAKDAIQDKQKAPALKIFYISADGEKTEQVVNNDRNPVISIFLENNGKNTMPNPQYDGVIFQLKNEPITKKYSQLKSQQMEKGNIQSEIFAQKQLIEQEHVTVKQKIKNKYENSVITSEFEKTFNGIVIKGIDIQQARELAKENEEIIAVFPNYEVKATLMDSVPLINADDVWNIGYTGQGVTIAIIDTGVDYTHNDLGGCFGAGCKVAGGYDFVNMDNDPIDDQGHGTHVAATAAGDGVLNGVAPDATIYAYKVLNSDGSGQNDWIISGIEAAIDPNNDDDFSDHLDILSMSLGGYGNPDDPMSQAVDNAIDIGVVAVIAAGNSGPGEQTIGSPGTARKAITVGATYKNGVIAPFSSRGPIIWNDEALIKPDLTAPGVNICAAEWDSAWADRRCLDEEHVAISGTSMATPHVAGAAALLLQKYPDATPEEIKSRLMNNAIDINEEINTQGTGMIDVLASLNNNIIISPGSISFGIDDISQDIWTSNKSFIIKNIDEISHSFVTSVEFEQTGGIYFEIQENIIIESDSHANIIFSLSVDNSVVPTGEYAGKLVLQDEEETYKIPFMFAKYNVLEVNFSEYPGLFIGVSDTYKIFGKYYPQLYEKFYVKTSEDYDLITYFSDVQENNLTQHYVINESFYIDEYKKIDVSKSYANNKITFDFNDINDNKFFPPLQSPILYSGALMLRSNIPNFLYNLTIVKISQISDRYSFMYQGTVIHPVREVYVMNFVVDEINENNIIGNDANDFRTIDLKYFTRTNPGKILPLFWSNSEYEGYSFMWDNTYLEKPFNATLYYINNLDFAYSYSSITIAELDQTDFFLSHTMGANLHLKDNIIERMSYGFNEPLTPITSNEITVGAYPYFWFGNLGIIVNEQGEKRLHVKTYKGALSWQSPLYKTQGYDNIFWINMTQNEIEIENIPYHLHHNGIVTTGNLYDLIYNGQELFGNGEYNLEINRNFTVDENVLNSYVNITFVYDGFQFNPPSISFFELLSDGKITDKISLDNTMIKFSLDPVPKSPYDEITVAELSYKNSINVWKQIPLTILDAGENYTVIGEVPNEPISKYIFRIFAKDSFNNSLEYIFDVLVEGTTCAGLLGDINKNGCIDRNDLELIATMVYQGAPIDWCADINQDGSVDSIDFLTLPVDSCVDCTRLNTCVNNGTGNPPPTYCNATGEIEFKCQLCGGCKCPDYSYNPPVCYKCGSWGGCYKYKEPTPKQQAERGI